MTELSHKASRINPEIQLLTLLVLFYGYTVVLLPTQGADLLFWAKWASYIFEQGLVSIYGTYKPSGASESTGYIYGPVYMYLLYLFGQWQGSVYTIYLNVHQVKALHLVFDMIGIWYAVRFVREPVDRPFYALLLLFNIGLMYNSVEWGQTDGVLACLLLIAIYYALQEKIAVSGIVFVTSLLIKPQPIIFLPLLGLLWLSTCLKKPGSYTLRNSLLVLGVIAVIVSPFIVAGTLSEYLFMLADTTEAYPFVTVNAANVWTLLLSGNTDVIPDTIVRLGLSYRSWGLLFFSVSYLIILFPLLRQFYLIQTGKRTSFTPSTVLLSGGLIPIIFYFFNTQMHERYAHVSILLLGAYALSSKDFFSYVVASVANFWIMNHFLKAINLHRFNTIPLEYIALLFFFSLSWGILQLYKPMIGRPVRTSSIPAS